MGPNRLDGLTARQLQCLRGKWDRKMDKEIAFELGISQRAVEGHLRGAREKLGVASTRAAVLMVAAREGWEGSVEPYYGPSDLPDAADSGAIPFPDEEGPVHASASVRDSWPRSGVRLAPIGPEARWPIPTREGQRNDLSTMQRLAWPFAIATSVMAILFLGFGVVNGAGKFIATVLNRAF
jgi:DNA-binding CsgD family transcriptional regulator